MTAGLSLDIALAALFFQRSYDDEAAGRDPAPNYRRSRAAIAPADAFVALGLAIDGLMRATAGDPDQLADALWLDADLAAEELHRGIELLRHAPALRADEEADRR